MKKYSFVATLLLSALIALAYRPVDEFLTELQKKLYSFTQEHPYTSLYLHLDKNVYMPGEFIWFKAYLPSSSEISSEALYIRLINDQQEVVMEKEFLVYDIRANGQIILPDTMKQGNYRLCAYTDKMMNFDLKDVFVQQFKVIANPGDQLTAAAYVEDTTSLHNGKHVALNMLLTRYNRPLKGGKGTYIIKTLENQTVTSGKITTDAAGKASVSFLIQI